jgi:hypothetical protein
MPYITIRRDRIDTDKRSLRISTNDTNMCEKRSIGRNIFLKSRFVINVLIEILVLKRDIAWERNDDLSL